MTTTRGPTNLPPEIQAFMGPRQFSGISELLAVMVGILDAASRSGGDPEITQRLYRLYDIIQTGLEAYVEKEFFVTPRSNIIPLLNRKLNMNLRPREKKEIKENKDIPKSPDDLKPL